MPVVKDVCSKCNNERLGALDSYGAQLTDKYFLRFLDPPIDARFECNTELLLRWLLKLLFNDARASAGAATEVYKNLRPFILGDSSNPTLNLNLLIGVIEPSPVYGSTEIHYPEHHGFANFNLSIPNDSFFELCRGVFLNSYVFAVLSWRSEIPRPTRRRLLEAIREANLLVELRRPNDAVHLTTPCMKTEAIVTSSFSGDIQFLGR